jgi:hypothetical protein
MARTPVVPEAVPVGALSAQLRRPRSRSATAGLRPNRPVRAIAGHPLTAWRTGEFDRGRVKTPRDFATDRAKRADLHDFFVSGRSQGPKKRTK